MGENLIDCEAGRRLGCRTFCCRLLVRLDEGEREPGTNGLPAKGFVDKGPDGLCIHLDRDTHCCGIWEKRPRICREYDCNHDYLLQAAIRLGVKNIAQLSRDSLGLHLSPEECIRIPGCSPTEVGDKEWKNNG